MYKGSSLNAEVTLMYWPHPLQDMTARITHFEKWLLTCHWTLTEIKCLTLVWVNLDMTINKVERTQQAPLVK